MSPSRFVESSAFIEVTPVRLPPGRPRLAANPSATGSPPISETIGVVVTAFFAAAATASLPSVTITAA